MTPDLLPTLIRTQLAASALILVVLAIRPLVRVSFGARVAYGLWLLPLVGAFATLFPAPVGEITAAPLTMARAAPALDWLWLAQDAAPIAAPSLSVTPFLIPVWVAGVVAALAWIAFHQARCWSMVRAGAFGPAVMGVVRPRIVLPADFEARYTAPERALILAHETAHLARQDPRAIAVALTFRAIAWFNPLAYIAVRALRIDQELACDETVLAQYPKRRRAYAQTLAKSQLAAAPAPLGCHWPSAAQHPLLQRLALLGRHSPSKRRRATGAALIALTCAAAAVTAWAATPQTTTEPPAELCLTNACSAPLRPLAEPRTIRDAIAAGQAHKVRDFGGTPTQALAAIDTRIQTRAKETPPPPDLQGYADEIARFGDTSTGATLTYFPAEGRHGGPPGVMTVGGVRRTSPDGKTEVMYLLDNGAGLLVQ